jgi:putative DNA methylase
MATWGDLFSARQLLTITTLAKHVRNSELAKENETALSIAVATFLGLAVSRFADICNALCMWETTKTQVRHVFTRHAIGMIWDFAEPNPLADAAGNFNVTLATMVEVIDRLSVLANVGQAALASATSHPLPEEAVQVVFTDPPYYDAVP